jgi:hypothetical protein
MNTGMPCVDVFKYLYFAIVQDIRLHQLYHSTGSYPIRRNSTRLLNSAIPRALDIAPFSQILGKFSTSFSGNSPIFPFPGLSTSNSDSLLSYLRRGSGLWTPYEESTLLVGSFTCGVRS